MDEAIGEKLVGAIAERDRARLAACFAPEAQLNALIPPGLRERTGAEAAADLIVSWFEDSTELELADCRVDAVGDRLHVSYSFRGVEEGEPYVVQQQLYCTVDSRGIATANLLCSGFRPPA